MKRLGYAQFVAQGGDLGAGVCTVMAKHAPPELLGIHTNFPGTIPSDIARALQCSDPPPSGLSADERRAYEQLTNLFTKKRAYAQMMATRPQTLYGLADSPVCLAAWLFDHGDGYGQPAAPITSAVLGRAINGYSAGDLTRGDVLDDFTLYWLTNTAISAARFYWELHLNLYNAANVSIPAAVSVFPGENYQAPRSWTERAYDKLIYYNQVDKGGTMRPGNSRNSFQKRFARASDRCGHRRRNWHFGKLDIVFANAGIAGRTPTGATDEAAAYAATKGGVVSMARAIAADFAPRNIRVNVVAPGATKTPIWKRGSRSAEQSAKLADLFSSTVPLGRWGEAEELAKAVLFLASEDSSYVNAVELVVDGGLTGAPFGAPMLRG